MKKRIRPNLRKTPYADRLRELDREYQRKRRKNNPEWKAKQNKIWSSNNLSKVKAQNSVRWVLRKVEKQKCRDCKRKDTHKHHPDYNKPLKIIWLCPIHHKLEHQKIKLTIMEKPNKEIMIRINTRIPKEQHEFIKELAEKLDKTEGEATRLIIKYYMGHAK